MEFRIRYKGCSCCPFLGFLGLWEGYHCKTTDMRIVWPTDHHFEQPEWCPLVKDGRVLIKQAKS